MADVYEWISPTGTITSDSGFILNEVVREYKDVFGQDLVVPDSLNPEGASTPQGLLIISEALARIAVANNNAALANQINPNLAGGIFLDAILALSGVQRTPATHSTVLCTLDGVVGTSIPAGSQVSVDPTGELFELITTTVIPLGGTISNVEFQSVLTGAIGAPAGQLTIIVSDVLGWEQCINPADAILGESTQSDVGARTFRLNTLFAQGSSVAGAIIAGVSLLDGVQSMTLIENTSAAPATIQDVDMVAHSIYACVDGGGNGSPSEVTITLTGVPATAIPAGSIVSETISGYAFEFGLTAPVVIGGGGTVDGVFVSLSSGEIPAPIGSLTTIVTPIVGWTSATNAAAAELGTESPVAQALVSKKSAGAAYNNTEGAIPTQGIPVSAIVQVPYSGQYQTVLYDNPTEITINVDVTVKVVTPVQDPVNAVKNAIVAYASGEISGVTGLVVGQNVSSFELAGAVTALYPGIYVQQLLIAEAPTAPTSPDEIAIDVFQKAVITTGTISVHLL